MVRPHFFFSADFFFLFFYFVRVQIAGIPFAITASANGFAKKTRVRCVAKWEPKSLLIA